MQTASGAFAATFDQELVKTFHGGLMTKINAGFITLMRNSKLSNIQGNPVEG